MKKSHAAGWASDSPTPAQLKEFFAQIEAGRITRGRLQKFLRERGMNCEDIAAEILGKNFINAAEIETAFGMKYTAEQLAILAATMPPEKVLREMAANEYMLVAGPPQAMSMLDVRAKKPELFYSKADDGWYCKQEQTFARDDKVGEGWLALRKKVVPNSTDKTWGEQQKLLSAEERVPNAAEVAWGVIAYKAVRDEFLLPTMYARTSSVSALGVHVLIGYFDAAGLHVYYYWYDDRDDGLGLAGARKF
ncbi:MAG: hypothetical protein V1902_00745 [Candidatus Falkowbacteria bacterium]